MMDGLDSSTQTSHPGSPFFLLWRAVYGAVGLRFDPGEDPSPQDRLSQLPLASHCHSISGALFLGPTEEGSG